MCLGYMLLSVPEVIFTIVPPYSIDLNNRFIVLLHWNVMSQASNIESNSITSGR